MNIIKGNIWKGIPPVMVVITTNSELKSNGELVMGAGIALEAVLKIPSLPKECGEIVGKLGRTYGFQVIRHPRSPGKPGLGIFQTKMSWRDNSTLMIINNSAMLLREYAMYNSDIPIRLNYPGIGFGRLTKEQVKPVLEKAFSDLNNISIYYA